MAVREPQQVAMVSPKVNNPIVVGMQPKIVENVKPNLVIAINYEDKIVEIPASIAPLTILAFFLMMLISPWFSIVILPIVIAILVGLGVGSITLQREEMKLTTKDSAPVEEE